ncbi:Globin-coupled histidine kinase [Stieleria neptunia]|uniref:histidine kinase n=1 Tax=Stieleria neptunia TaxID=2527979 RepID=A0A518HSZ4_9BACT|nr:ATP-binding protein [Stieleria neptunia]QDV43962.1 Globin-coupled histidine kinase [Stieleria neptunia]
MKLVHASPRASSRSIFSYIVLLVVITILVSWAIAGALIQRRIEVNRLSRKSNSYHSTTRMSLSRIQSELSLIRQHRYRALLDPSDATLADEARRETGRSAYMINQRLRRVQRIQRQFDEPEFEASTRRLADAVAALNQAVQRAPTSPLSQTDALDRIGVRWIQLDRLHAHAFRDDARVMQSLEDSRMFLASVFSLSGLGLAAIVAVLVVAKRAVTRRDEMERKLAQRAMQAELLYRAVMMSEDTQSYPDALEKCVKIVCQMTDWSVGHAYWPSPSEPSRLVSADIWHFPDPERLESFRQAVENTFFVTGDCLPGRIWETGQPAWIENIQQDPNFIRKTLCESHGLRSALGFPLVIDGQVVAVLEFFSERTIQADEVMLLMARSVGEQVGRVLERIQVKELQRRHHERVEAELNEAKKELVVKTRLAAIGQVSAQVAHEIRNPLGAISNAIYYLKRSPRIDQQKKTQYLDLMNHEIATCNEFINELLDITRRRKLDRQPTRLADLMERVLSRSQMPQNIDLQLHCIPDTFECFVDEDQFVQVLQNLLNNSLDSLQETGGQIRITARRGDGRDVIIVRDSGPGIPMPDRGSVFDVLFTTKSTGTGLGLAICKQIVEQHGGTIRVADGESEGTEFQICLPCVPTTSNSIPSPTH